MTDETPETLEDIEAQVPDSADGSLYPINFAALEAPEKTYGAKEPYQPKGTGIPLRPGKLTSYRGYTFDEIMDTIELIDIQNYTRLSSIAISLLSQKTGIAAHSIRQIALGKLIPSERHWKILKNTWIGRLIPPPKDAPDSLLDGKNWDVISNEELRSRKMFIKINYPVNQMKMNDYILTYRDKERRVPAWIRIHTIERKDAHVRLFSNGSHVTSIPLTASLTYAFERPGMLTAPRIAPLDDSDVLFYHDTSVEDRERRVKRLLEKHRYYEKNGIAIPPMGFE